MCGGRDRVGKKIQRTVAEGGRWKYQVFSFAHLYEEKVKSYRFLLGWRSGNKRYWTHRSSSCRFLWSFVHRRCLLATFLERQLFSRLSEVKVDSLSKSFSDDQIKQAIDSMHPLKAPRPDGFAAGFNQTSWDVIKTNFMNLVKDFEQNLEFIRFLNSATLVLIPKKDRTSDNKDFRPIRLTIY